MEIGWGEKPKRGLKHEAPWINIFCHGRVFLIVVLLKNDDDGFVLCIKRTLKWHIKSKMCWLKSWERKDDTKKNNFVIWLLYIFIWITLLNVNKMVCGDNEQRTEDPTMKKINVTISKLVWWRWWWWWWRRCCKDRRENVATWLYLRLGTLKGPRGDEDTFLRCGVLGFFKKRRWMK